MTLKNDNCFPIISFIDCEKNTLDSILSTTPIPREFDLMSMDVDGNDIYIWEGLKNYDPKVVILEYNSNFSSNDSLAIKYDARHVHKLDDYYGATAGAFEKLAKKKDYSLVGYTRGLNLIYCKNKYIKDNFYVYNYMDIEKMVNWGKSKNKMISY